MREHRWNAVFCEVLGIFEHVLSCKYMLLVVVLLLFSAPPRSAYSSLLTFEEFSDSEQISAQFAGVAFQNATALTAGISLNEFEFPPKSGTNVVFDDIGPIKINFAEPQKAVSAYLTYLTPVTFSAFDALDNLLGSDSSDFVNNSALSGELGSSPNEPFNVTSLVGISFIVINGDPFGSSYTLDDFTFTPLTAGIPEPSTLLLASVGLAGVVIWRVIQNKRGCCDEA